MCVCMCVCVCMCIRVYACLYLPLRIPASRFHPFLRSLGAKIFLILFSLCRISTAIIEPAEHAMAERDRLVLLACCDSLLHGRQGVLAQDRRLPAAAIRRRHLRVSSVEDGDRVEYKGQL